MKRSHGIVLTCAIVGGAVVLTRCQQATPVTPRRPELDPTSTQAKATTSTSLITVAYTCGNFFRVRNANTSTVTVTYTVVGTSEHGTLVLPAKSSAYAYSETYLRTVNRGTVVLKYSTATVATTTNTAKACAAVATQGSWTSPTPWPIVAIHAALLPNGKVMTWGRTEIVPAEEPIIWDPVADPNAQHPQPQFPVATNPFCAGHALMPDGRLLVAGGRLAIDESGPPRAFTFSTATSSWTQLPNMRAGRWYPTVTALANGEMLVESGTDSLKNDNIIPEVLQTNGTWRELTGAQRHPGYYPWNFVGPDGRVFAAGQRDSTRWITTSGTGSLTAPMLRNVHVVRDYGSAVMYDAGKIIVMGGGNTEASAETIDLTQSNPQWKLANPMAFSRRQMSAVIQADGQVLASGGAAGSTFNPNTNIRLIPEVWNPTTGLWTQMAAMHVPRLYHSNTLLLPDGRILSAGGGQPPAISQQNQFNAEFYSPPYLFNPDGTPATASRPIIASLPTSVGYNQQFTVQTQNVIAAKVLWIRLGVVTHSFNQNQRLNYLSFTQNGGALTVTTPASPNLAPPGHYLIYVLNALGTPSVGKIIQIH